MKKIFIATMLGFVSVLSFSALAQEQGEGPNREGNFADLKARVISTLEKEKSVLDQAISCVNAASKPEDMNTCHNKQREGMKALHESKRAERKEHLQNELKKLEAKDSEEPKQ